MEFEAILKEKEHAITVREDKEKFVVTLDGKEYIVDFCEPEESFYSLLIDGKSYEISINRNNGDYTVYLFDSTFNMQLYDPMKKMLMSTTEDTSSGPKTIVSPMPGRVVNVLVNEGDEVMKGQGIVIVEAMKMENELKAPRDGIISKIIVSTDNTVESNQPLVVIK